MANFHKKWTCACVNFLKKWNGYDSDRYTFPISVDLTNIL